MKLNVIKEENYKIINSFFTDFFKKKFDISIIEKIFYFENNQLYELCLNKVEIDMIPIDINTNKIQCDLLIIFNSSTDETNNLNHIIEFNTKDLVFMISNNKLNIKLNNNFNKKYFVELKEFRSSLKKIFDNSYDFIMMKKVDSPNLDSSLLIQSICNDNGDKHIMFGYQKNMSMQFYFKAILEEIKDSKKNNRHLSYLRFGDGDFYLLRNLNHGSAKIGSRSVLKEINNKDLQIIRNSFWKNKNICIERTYDSHNRIFLEVLFSYFDNSILLNFLNSFFKTIKIYDFLNKFIILILTSNKFKFLGKTKFFYKILYLLIKNKLKKLKREDLLINFKECNFIPFESIYALVSSRWIFKNYPKNIAVVGNAEKIKLIKQLSQNQNYLAYLGIEKFQDFIEVPQKGAASDLKLSLNLKKRIEKSNADIFLFGIGSMKIHLFPLLEDINKIFIDVGCGIDALAGVVSQDRPYFSRWTNYQFENISFENIDLMDQNNPMRFAKKYSTVYIKK